jgi:hypothetical protein
VELLMLNRLSKRIRRKLTLTMGVLYVVCSVAPAIALARADGSTTVPCISEHHHASHIHHVASQSHAHADGKMHQHSRDNSVGTDNDETTALAPSCCGLFCLSALPADAVFLASEPARQESSVAFLEQRLLGNSPDRIDRPPRG